MTAAHITQPRAPAPAADSPVPRPLAVADKFRLRVQETPDRTALTDGDLELTYAQLDRFTDRLAAELLHRGLGPERIVAVDVVHKIEAAVVLLAVLKAGAVYLPLESGAPAGWKEFVLADSGAALLFVGSDVDTAVAGIPRLRWQRPDVADLDRKVPVPACTAAPGAAACVVYTSGTTGRPKGVCLPRDLLSDHLDAIIAGFGLRPVDRSLQFSPVHADTAIEQVLSNLVLGATVVVCTERLSVPEMLGLWARQRVTVAHLATGYWHVIANSLEWRTWPDLPLRLVMVGGDRMSPRAVALWREKTGIPVLNAYGPTETVITPNVHPVSDVDDDLGVPIGEVVGDRCSYVLDERLQPVPAGTNGELYLGGRMLARGYLGRPGMTARVFLPDPFSDAAGARMYRTGDIVRRGREGRLYFIGRADNQVKYRGFRVELGEIDSVLAQHQAVRDCAVVAREDRPGDLRLVAYVVPVAADPSPAELRTYLAERLPDHMVPGLFSFLPGLPLTSSNKVDRRALRGERYRPVTHSVGQARHDDLADTG